MIVLYRFDSFQSGVEFRAAGEVDQSDIDAFEQQTLGSVTKLYCFEDGDKEIPMRFRWECERTTKGLSDTDLAVTVAQELEDAITNLEQALDDVHVHAVILARAHQHYLNLDTPTAQHVGAIIRRCRKALPRLANVSAEAEAAVRALPPDEATLLDLYRRKRAVDGGGAVRRTWDAAKHYELDAAIEAAELALERQAGADEPR